LSEASGFEIPPELVFTHATATQIAEYIGSLAGSDQGNMGIRWGTLLRNFVGKPPMCV